jgi:K+-transporting ATPase ATPase B chain
MTAQTKPTALITPQLVKEASSEAFKKLDPRHQLRNPVMFVVYVGSILITLDVFLILLGVTQASLGFTITIAVWLWFTVLFATFSEAIAEGRGKAQANALRSAKKDIVAKRLDSASVEALRTPVESIQLRKGDLVLVEAGDMIPADGEVEVGAATVDESAVTGESAPVIRESGGDRSSVTGGTKVLSDWLIIRVSANPGESFLDRMIGMVEGTKRKRTPNEIALNILLCFMTISFLLACMMLFPFTQYAVTTQGGGSPISIVVATALLVCLIPTTIGGLLSAIGIAGMDRMIQKNVIALSGRAVEAAGDVNVLLLDKTGTITLGNREAVEFFPAPGISVERLADVAQLSSLADETPEGRSIVVLAKTQHQLRERNMAQLGAKFVPFTAQTRMSGVDFGDTSIRKGAADMIRKFVESKGGEHPAAVDAIVQRIAQAGGTPLAVAEGNKVLGVIYLKDIVKGGLAERFQELRQMGIKTVMITGDNPLTAAAIAAESGVDDFLAEATPEAKLELIRKYQAEGSLVAMTGDGTNDAPALAQADVAVAMNSGTQAAKEAGNMVDLDSNPTKLIEIVQTGKQLLMTRGALTTFSLANDVAKYFAILPAAFAVTYPELMHLNIMRLHSPESAIVSAVIFNAMIIICLVPLALKGIAYKPRKNSATLSRNLLIFGLGGLAVPFIAIKLIDIVVSLFL